MIDDEMVVPTRLPSSVSVLVDAVIPVIDLARAAQHINCELQATPGGGLRIVKRATRSYRSRKPKQNAPHEDA